MRPKAFTLIELLVVIAIIGILAMIAVPMFQHARTKALIAKVVADMRSMETAIEQYRLDNNHYPYTHGFAIQDQDVRFTANLGIWVQLTSPIPYLSGPMFDPFVNWDIDDVYKSGVYIYYYGSPPGRYPPYKHWWYLNSWGPDRKHDNWDENKSCKGGHLVIQYRATNGLMSE